MSTSYVFTVVGAYNYDRTIFDGLELPNESFIKDYNLVKNFIPMDKETFINNLLIQCGQLSLPFTDIDFLKESITVWSRMHKTDWQQLYETIFYAYNPIWNKDGTITETEERSTEGGTQDRTNITRVKTVEDDTDRQKTDTETGTITNDGTESTDTVNYVNAFDSGTDVKHDKTERDTATENTETFNKSYGTDEDVNRNVEENESVTDTRTGDKTETSSFTNTRTEKGNIGVTTTQRMIQEQRDIIFNMYQHIIDSFKENFCLLIW